MRREAGTTRLFCGRGVTIHQDKSAPDKLISGRWMRVPGGPGPRSEKPTFRELDHNVARVRLRWDKFHTDEQGRPALRHLKEFVDASISEIPREFPAGG